MSDTDSFIDEVTEEVRRDRLFLMLKRYGWIGGAVVALIVGGAALREYSKAQDQAAAEALGDAITAALEIDGSSSQSEALAAVSAESAGGAAVLKMLEAGALADAGKPAEAVARLEAVAVNGELPLIYRHIASFKALALQAGTLSADDRRLQYEALAQPGAPLGLLASEQLALLDIEAGNTPAAIGRLREIAADASVSADLKERATQLIVALGGSMEDASAPEG
ncbi:hypothetical protein [Leisingera methylohalidivorans]|uniref:Tetratricopeptide repeat-like domain-containing protein n=1 Tax=Leisingera methylohalidivorans DSM 14336 TaxID=999552 RepID=V9VSE2_9RHOB|nr:hypothetical protein [Leisingera methylohalidivorans]AHD00629.1 hypothetical protein METH_07915 [Leisingera methylohalidivorans DSM 14336]